MKRFFDLLLAVILILVLIVPMICIAVLIRFTSKGSVIYWSKRIGYDNQVFNMPKFRTMKLDTPVIASHLIKNVNFCYSPMGRFLRKTSIDEFPQLFSILKGDMSFVGPRPALFNQYDLIKLREELGINLSLPGITGWAQVNGRDELSVTEKVDLEKEYIQKKSLLFDLKILFLTLLKVIKSNDITH